MVTRDASGPTSDGPALLCPLNVSEGRDRTVIDRLVAAAGADLLDVHTDAHHHRSVLTLVGEQAPRRVAEAAVASIDLGRHSGVHPRIGVVDVVPFVPGPGRDDLGPALAARDRFAAWAADALGVPCFVYGPERSLPEVRRHAFSSLAPQHGPGRPHPRAGAVAVGARRALVAYNVWLVDDDLDLARRVAGQVRSPSIRALGLQVGDRVQVSMNLVDPWRVGPADAADEVAVRAPVAGCELVGLLPRAVLDRVDPERWDELDLGPDRTIEARWAAVRS